MRSILLIALLAAAPAAAQETVRLPDGSIVARASWAELKTADGRAKMHQAIQRSARQACADVHPLRDRNNCERQVVAEAESRAIAPVARQLRLARQEAATTELAAR